MFKISKGMVGALAGAVLVLPAASVSAATYYTDSLFTQVGYIEGNDCHGDGGTEGSFGDNSCSYDGSPFIVKLDSSDFNDGTGGAAGTYDEWNDGFGSFADFGGIVVDYSDTEESWYFEYLNDGDDTGITAFIAKGGNPEGDDGPGFYVYEYTGPGDAYFGNAGEGILFEFAQGSSHVTFFDSGIPEVPLPAAGFLLLGGLGGLALMRRRSK